MNDKRSYVRNMFGRIAPRYDLLNRLMSMGMDQAWRRRAAQLALEGSSDSPCALDLATGTGDLIIALDECKPGTRVVGLDLTYEMLALAPNKLAGSPAGTHALGLINGDGLDLPFPDNTFDAITSAFMLRNLVDVERGFREMVRVTRPGGRIVALEITRPRLPVWRALFELYFYRMVPILGGIISGDPGAYSYLPNSLQRFISPEELAATMARAGVRDVRWVLLNLGTVAIHYGVKPFVKIGLHNP
ncbi:MAG: ubiquinone/menaquinone biosynthesis methyltransferase [Anaerolineae bacterium]